MSIYSTINSRKSEVDQMINFIVGLVLLIILAPAVRYIVKEKKKGNACIGCPGCSKCGKHNCKEQ